MSTPFDFSPVPTPAWDATPPEEYRGIYGMPAFTTVCTADLPASMEFWTNALGFFTLFEIPGQLVHLRRWAFQDVLLVPGGRAGETVSSAVVNFSCVLHQIEPLVTACRRFNDVVVADPRDTPWNSREVEIMTPERVRVVFTAAKPYDPTTQEGANLRAVGITTPGPEADHNEPHDG